MKRCSQCVLPSSFPGISFNNEGVCRYCQKNEGSGNTGNQKKIYEDKFLSLLRKNNNHGSYDLIMAYSGGKDSTYTLDVFVNRYKLKVLAFTFDNTFIPDNALQNIRTVCSCLGVDHITIRPDPDMLRAVFRTASKEELYSQKTIERASTICTSCIGFVKSIVLRTAIEKGVPFVGFGWSPGQAPVEASVMKTNASLISTTQKSIYGPLYTIVGDRINPYFLFEEHFTQEDKFPWNIHPLAFLDYNEEKIIERNNQLGWIKPGNTDANSTNCLLNAFANQVHKERYGFHPYVWELANMVRAGVMDRTCALHKIETPENPEIVSYARDILE